MLAKQALVFTVVALVAAAATLLASMEPSFTQAGGSPIGLGIAAAGFAIAAALSGRR